MSSFSRGKAVLGRSTPLNQQNKLGDSNYKGLVQTRLTGESNVSQSTAKTDPVVRPATHVPTSGQTVPAQTMAATPKYSSPMQFAHVVSNTATKPSTAPPPPAPAPAAKSQTHSPPPRPKMVGLKPPASMPNPPKVAATEEDPYASTLDALDPSEIPDAPATHIPAVAKTAPPAPTPPKLKPATADAQPKQVSPVVKPPALTAAKPAVKAAPLLPKPPAAPAVPAKPSAKPPAMPSVASPGKPSTQGAPQQTQLAPAPEGRAIQSETIDTSVPTPTQSVPAALVQQPDPITASSFASSDTATAVTPQAASPRPMPPPAQPATGSPKVPSERQHNQNDIDRFKAQLAFKEAEVAKIEFNRMQNIAKPADDSLSNETYTSEESPCELAEPRVRCAPMVPGMPPFILPLNTQHSTGPPTRLKRKPVALSEASNTMVIKKSKTESERTALENEQLRIKLQGYKHRMKSLRHAFNGDYDHLQPDPHDADFREEFRRIIQEEMAPVRAAISVSPSMTSKVQLERTGPAVEDLLQLQSQREQLTKKYEQLSKKFNRLEEEHNEREKEKAAEAQKMLDRVKELQELVLKANETMKSIVADRDAAIGRESSAIKAREEIVKQLEAANVDKVHLLERIRNLEMQHEKKISDLQGELTRARADHQAVSDALAETQSTKRQLQESHEDLANTLAEVRNSKAADLQRIARFEKENEELRTRVIVLEQRAEEARHSHRDLLGRVALTEKQHLEAQERVKELTTARDSALASLERRNSEFAQLQHENESIVSQLREGIIRELNRQSQETAAAVASTLAAPTAISADIVSTSTTAPGACDTEPPQDC